VLPVLGDLLKGLEEARQRHKPIESQATRPLRDEATLSLPLTQASTRHSNTRRSKASARAVASESVITTVTPVDDFAQSQIDAASTFTSLEHHFSVNINAAWQKLDDYYTRTDDTPIYRLAVFLHPLLKWRWFERYWETKPEWIAAAREVVTYEWSKYKIATTNSSMPATPADDDDE
jgi:hypothetical protein